MAKPMKDLQKEMEDLMTKYGVEDFAVVFRGDTDRILAADSRMVKLAFWNCGDGDDKLKDSLRIELLQLDLRRVLKSMENALESL